VRLATQGRTLGEDRLAIRLTLFSLYNEARGTQRVETWGHLCRELGIRMNLSCVHFIEPRYEQVHNIEEKQKCKSGFPQIVDPKLISLWPWAPGVFQACSAPYSAVRLSSPLVAGMIPTAGAWLRVVPVTVLL
jgi:hypothetical protein